MIDERADDVRIAKIHAQPHAGIVQHVAVVIGNVDGVAQERLVDRNAVTIPRTWKCSWWMWKSCSSLERFSMIQSSTSPCLTTMSGASEVGSNGLGVWPSTVR